MATSISTKPAPPQQKMKRPPLPSVQTNVNGAKSSQSSPSPSLSTMSSKRLPSAFKYPSAAAATNGANSVSNGTGSRISNRRRDSQKPGEGLNRQTRMSKQGQADAPQSAKRIPEPYVKTIPYILKKYKKFPPSLVLHLHPTHFRFDLQDGSFSYNSPMKVILEHVKAHTVPHDMMEELFNANVKFYEDCLIVQIQDHRNTSSTAQSSSNSTGDKNVPFSIHNFNSFTTPSPFVPYPHPSTSTIDASKEKTAVSHALDGTAGPTTQEANKENSTSSGQTSKSLHKGPAKGPNVFTTVLFSTPLTLEEEVLIQANTPDPRANIARKQSQINNRTPASATMTHPPTPLSAVPPTPSTSGPPTKKQKMMVSGKDLRSLESKIIAATAAPLYLEPVDNFQDSQRVLHLLRDPLFENAPPPPKTRKRTVAELAADEALAAEEERFMLIMDERLAPSSTNAGTGKVTNADGEIGAAAFEPRFERFKVLEDIRINLRIAQEEKRRRELEQKALAAAHAQATKAREEQMQHEQRQRIQEQSQRDLNRRKALQQNQAALQAMQQAAASQNPHSHPQTTNGMIAPHHPPMLPGSQAQHSSPVVRDMTPLGNSSPLIGNNLMVSHPNQSVAMSVTASRHSAGSPPRPGSAIPHSHPGAAAVAAHQRNQQTPSRNGTPHMPNGTPNMQHATPVLRNATSTPNLGHASPAHSGMTPTPTMAHNVIPTPHMPNQQMTTQQQQMAMRNLHLQQHALQQQQQQQHQQHQQQMHTSPPNQSMQMSPANLQQLAQQQAHQQRSNQEYQNRVRQMVAQQHHQQQQQQHAAAQQAAAQRSHLQHQQQQQQQQQQHPSQQSSHQPHPGVAAPSNGIPRPPQQPPNAVQQRLRMGYEQQRQRAYQTFISQLGGQYGPNIPQQMVASAGQRAIQIASVWLQNERKRLQQFAVQHQQQQQQAMAQMAAMNGGGGGMGGGM